ncbi:Glycosyl hydrolase family 10 protein, putative [Theobroma cacao]|uniref:Glycosyl hydrolase family 10 protein, putative n=1 Tax=Theobroma cacao TaxID=3641 RepID=A0A061F8L2_THECC|nr:Glycosyl hydrolase family 10 protein, putative [Theobroma cacao]
MSKYKEEFIHWDVSNEMLHFDFYEQRLGPDATLHFYETAHQSDPLATLFMNEFNVVETCSDVKSTVDTYIERIRDLKQGGMYMDGIGLGAIYLEQVLREASSHPSVNGIMLWTALHPKGEIKGKQMSMAHTAFMVS